MQILNANLIVTLCVLFKHSRQAKFAQIAFAASFPTSEVANEGFELQLLWENFSLSSYHCPCLSPKIIFPFVIWFNGSRYCSLTSSCKVPWVILQTAFISVGPKPVQSEIILEIQKNIENIEKIERNHMKNYTRRPEAWKNAVGTIEIVTKCWEEKGGIGSASATLYNLDLLQWA